MHCLPKDRLTVKGKVRAAIAEPEPISQIVRIRRIVWIAHVFLRIGQP